MMEFLDEPVDSLWLPGDSVLEAIIAEYGTLAAAKTHLWQAHRGDMRRIGGQRGRHRSSNEVALWRLETQPAWRAWVRLDVADRLLCALGMVPTLLDIPLTYSRRMRPQ
jgi:hypothetical protein